MRLELLEQKPVKISEKQSQEASRCQCFERFAAHAEILTRKHELGHGETVNPLGGNQWRLRFPGNHAAMGVAQAHSVALRGGLSPGRVS